jgi:hypothetical protein
VAGSIEVEKRGAGLRMCALTRAGRVVARPVRPQPRRRATHYSESDLYGCAFVECLRGTTVAPAPSVAAVVLGSLARIGKNVALRTGRLSYVFELADQPRHVSGERIGATSFVLTARRS